MFIRLVFHGHGFMKAANDVAKTMRTTKTINKTSNETKQTERKTETEKLKATQQNRAAIETLEWLLEWLPSV